MLANASIFRKIRAVTAALKRLAEAHLNLVVVVALDGKLKDGLVLRRNRVRDTTVFIIRKAIRIDFVTLRIALDKRFV